MGQPDRVHLRREIALLDRLGTTNGWVTRTVRMSSFASIIATLASPAIIGQDFGMARIVQTSRRERLFVDRRRNDAADVAIPRQSDRGNDGVVSSASADRRNLADGWQDDKLRGAKQVGFRPQIRPR